jgi:hypothetical protein
MVTPSVMLKTSIPHRFESDKRYSEDFFLWQTLILNNYSLYYLKFKGAFILKQENSLSKNKLRMRWENIKNYLVLWKNKKINIFILTFCIIYSSIKHIVYILTPQLHFFLRQISEK